MPKRKTIRKHTLLGDAKEIKRLMAIKDENAPAPTPGPYSIQIQEDGRIDILGGPDEYAIAGMYFTGYPKAAEATARFMVEAMNNAAIYAASCSTTYHLKHINARLIAAATKEPRA